MNQTKPNNELVPGGLYQLNYWQVWSELNLFNKNPYRDFDVSPADILLYLRKEKIKTDHQDMPVHLFLNKNSIILVAYDYFQVIKEKHYIKI